MPSSSRTARTRAVVAALAFGALGACGQCGTSPYAGTTTWENGAHQVRFRYLESPWHVRGGDMIETLEMEIDPVTGPDSGVPPKYQVNIEVVSGTALGVLVADHAVAAGRGEIDLPGGMVGFTTDSGDIGTYWAGTIPGAFARSFLHVGYDIPGTGRVLHVVIEANVDPRTPELLAMLAEADVLPFSPP